MNTNTHKHHWQVIIVSAIIILPILAYGIMRYLPDWLNLDENTTGSHFIVTLLIIAILLAVPYWMLKLGFENAHLRDSNEPEVQLKDIPKDKEQIARKS